MKGTAPYDAAQSLSRSLGRVPTSAEILNLRNDPTLSIQAAGDLIADNFKVMKNYGYDASELDVADREKFAYALHHEGEGAVKRMIDGSFTDAMGEKHFMPNVPDAISRAPYLAAAGNSYGKAYQNWFSEMIDNRFNPQPFSTAKLNAPDRLREIFSEFRGQ